MPKTKYEGVCRVEGCAQPIRWVAAASSRNCIACGKQAREWAYQGGDPDELTTDPALRCENDDMKYSTDLTFYQPMCTRCHRLMDGSLDHTKARDAAGRWGAA